MQFCSLPPSFSLFLYMCVHLSVCVFVYLCVQGNIKASRIQAFAVCMLSVEFVQLVGMRWHAHTHTHISIFTQEGYSGVESASLRCGHQRAACLARALLGMCQRPGSLAKPESFRPEILGVARFTVDFSIFVCQGCGLQAFATFGTSETALMPRIPSSYDLLSSIHGPATARTHVRATQLLGKLGGIGVVGGAVGRLPFWFDSQVFTSVHA